MDVEKLKQVRQHKRSEIFFCAARLPATGKATGTVAVAAPATGTVAVAAPATGTVAAAGTGTAAVAGKTPDGAPADKPSDKQPAGKQPEPANAASTMPIVVGASDGTLMEFDALAEKVDARSTVVRSGHAGYVTGVAVGAGRVISGAYDRKLVWRDAATGEVVRTVDNAHGKWIRRVVASPDGRLVASVADDMTPRLWDAATGEKVRDLPGGHAARTPNHFPSMLYGAAWSADGTRLATCDKVGHVVVWDVATGRQLGSVEAPLLYTWDPKARIHSIGGARSLAWSADGSRLAVGGMGKVGNIDHLEGKAALEVFDVSGLTAAGGGPEAKGRKLFEHQSDKFKGLVEALVFLPPAGAGKDEVLVAVGGDMGGWLIAVDAKGKAVTTEKMPAHVHDAVLDAGSGTLVCVGHGHTTVWAL